MNPSQRELFRTALLSVLEANDTKFGLRAEALERHVNMFGFHHPGFEAIETELRYLKDKGFVLPLDKAISPENQTWRITAAGRDWLATNG
jgi:hypothetical protein